LRKNSVLDFVLKGRGFSRAVNAAKVLTVSKEDLLKRDGKKSERENVGSG